MRGKVLDPTGAPITGAKITAVPTGASVLSGPDGDFRLELEQARYTLKVAAEGFLEVSRSIELTQSGTEVGEFVLQIAGVHEIMTVTESAGYRAPEIGSGTKTLTPLTDLPQSVTVITRD